MSLGMKLLPVLTPCENDPTNVEANRPMLVFVNHH